MKTNHDTYWDELGVTWTAINPDIEVLMPRLRQKLRRQSLLIASGMIIAIPLTVVGLALGLFTIWLGATAGTWNFVVRGMAIIIVAAMAGKAVFNLLPVRADENAKPLLAMLDLAIARAQRSLTLVSLGLYACVVAAVFGIAGTVVRTYLSGPPQQSPAIDLLLLALVALVLVLCRGHVKVFLTKMSMLRKLLRIGGNNS